MTRGAVLALLATIVASGCGPKAVAVVPGPPPPSSDQKLRWILQLEDQRIVRGPERGQDLVVLINDSQAHIRRRAAHAAGRARLVETVPALSALVASEPDNEVRQMAAFALGLIGDASAAPVLTDALGGADPIVQARAAEALGLIGHTPSAEAIGAMMSTHLAAGAFDSLAPDDVGYPKSAPTEAVRSGLYALVRLGAYDVVASTMLDGNGQSRSRWWPVAFAFQRLGDPRGAPTLTTLVNGEGQVTRAFAARGLGTIKHGPAVPTLAAIAASGTEPHAVRVQAMRALGSIGDVQAAGSLVRVIATPKIDPNLEFEATTALGQLRAPAAVELLTNLASSPSPNVRGAALVALARTDPDTFIGILSTLGPDPDWSVRASLADALGEIDAARAEPPLKAMLHENDQRVLASVLRAVTRGSSPSVVPILTEHLTKDDPVVRMTAANGLATLKATGAVGPLLKALDDSQRDNTYVARAAILNALSTLDPAAARGPLVAALADNDWAVRVRASELLRAADPSTDVSSMAPAPPSVVPELNDLDALLKPAYSPMAYVDTPKGMIQIELAVVDAPRTVANFIALVRKGFYTNLPWHRVVSDFVVQGGDPRGDGEGGPGHTIRDEINQRKYMRGTVGMALDWADTGGSQFFITHSPQPHLDARYTVFGDVVEGIDVVDRLSRWDLIRSVRVWDGVAWIGTED